MSVCIHVHACACHLRVRICVGAICTFSHYITFSSGDVLAKVVLLCSSSGCGMWCH